MAAIKSILFPVDFTESSLKVLPYVKFLSEKLGAGITVVHVVMGPEEFASFEMGPALYTQFEDQVLKGAEKAMEKFIEENLNDCKDITQKVVVGDTVEEILNLADEMDSPMIVMGTHGRKGLEKIVFGSVANGVVKKAGCPVLTVNPHKI